MLQVVLQNAQIDPQTGRVVSPLLRAVEEGGKRVDVSELFKQWVIKAGTNDWDKIIIEEDSGGSGNNQTNGEVPIEQVEQEMAEFEQQLGGMQQPTQEQVPQGGIYA
jgi:hypothetical protein